MWLQRSRVSWLKEGDKNTSYFHKKASGRRRQNHISKIKNSEGSTVDDEEGIAQIFNQYFMDLFSSNGAPNMDRVVAAVDNKIDEHMKADLSKPYSKEEVFFSLSQIHPSKAPGPDGMPALFY